MAVRAPIVLAMMWRFPATEVYSRANRVFLMCALNMHHCGAGQVTHKVE
jgi:hypothetical protein